MLVGIIVLALMLSLLVVTPYILSRIKDEAVEINTPFDLRYLKPGRELVLQEVESVEGAVHSIKVVLSRPYYLKDAEIAFVHYHEQWKVIPQGSRKPKRPRFLTLSDFIDYVSVFTPSLKDELKAREVDPSEYEPDRSSRDNEPQLWAE